jgi:DNA repair exonuclease SbcCD ATPase subunit
MKFHAPLAALAFALVVVLIYGLHERSVAAHSSAQNAEATAQLAQLKDARAQINALSAKLDEVVNAQQTSRQPAGVAPADSSSRVVRSTGQRQKPDPRWKKVQAQLDAQGKQLDAQGKEIESNRQEIASARTDLSDSIAKTHDELVVLQKKGERNYFEFDLAKSKSFNRVGPVGVSLRKANTKNQFADLKLLVDDRELSKKHLNLYEPVIFYPTDERTPVEIVINGISKNHVHGYISAAKYGRAELQASNAVPSQAAVPSNNTSGETDAKARQKLQAQH